MYKSLFTGDGHEITDPNWVIPQEGPSFFSDRILGPSSSHHGSFVNSACHYRTKRVFILTEILAALIPDKLQIHCLNSSIQNIS